MVSDDAVNLTMKPTTESTTDADVDADKDADAATTVSALTTAVDIVTTDISITSTGPFSAHTFRHIVIFLALLRIGENKIYTHLK